mmetsp:Transcript_3000/g.7191  ORF Transcript_3000/g.7191 Transcript_3000/m.7191 type:complete len:92 (+) Transcript_3000:1-276(+)
MNYVQHQRPTPAPTMAYCTAALNCTAIENQNQDKRKEWHSRLPAKSNQIKPKQSVLRSHSHSHSAFGLKKNQLRVVSSRLNEIALPCLDLP